MKKNIEKIYNISSSILYITYITIALILYLKLPKYNIFFPGWWTLILIIPSLGNLLFQNNKGFCLYTLITGILLLLSSNSIITYNKCFTILICLAIIFIGIDIIIVTLRIPEKKKSNTKYIPFYYAFFGSTDEKVESKFSGGYTKLVFGHLSLDLSSAKIEKNSTLKVLSVFGETEIILPSNIEAITTNTNILGGTENLKKSSSKKSNNIYIESISILGNTKIK
ncbi:MAG: hypothetical protein ACI4XM_02165 [Candidatus Coprovivens sp.]